MNKINDADAQLLIMLSQYVQLQKKLKFAIPGISKKLVNDLLVSGVPASKIAKVIKRSKNFVKLAASGEKSLSAEQCLEVIGYAARRAKNGS